MEKCGKLLWGLFWEQGPNTVGSSPVEGGSWIRGVHGGQELFAMRQELFVMRQFLYGNSAFTTAES